VRRCHIKCLQVVAEFLRAKNNPRSRRPIMSGRRSLVPCGSPRDRCTIWRGKRRRCTSTIELMLPAAHLLRVYTNVLQNVSRQTTVHAKTGRRPQYRTVRRPQLTADLAARSTLAGPSAPSKDDPRPAFCESWPTQTRTVVALIMAILVIIEQNFGLPRSASASNG